MKWFLLAGIFLLGCSNQKSLNDPKISHLALSHIVGGTTVSASNPISASIVQVYKVSASNQTISTCTGNIIASHLILTAAHCVAGTEEKNFIYFSTTIPTDIFQFFQAQVAVDNNLRSVLISATPNSWDANSLKPEKDWDDLALLKFAGELPAGYRPVKLTNDAPHVGESLLIAGFGMTDGIHQIRSSNLQQASVPVLDFGWSSTEILLDSSHGKAPCHGDSGGPAYLARNTQVSLVAIDSRSELKSDLNFECTGYTVYTRVGAYLDWISTQVRKLN